VFSALGLYPQAGTDRYWLGSPAVKAAKLRLGDGSTLEITALNAHPKNVYVQKVSPNGVRLCEPTLTHAELSGAKLEFEMGRAAAPFGGYCTKKENALPANP
jgi:putative alpha-1,2-mannosidase